MRLTDFIMTNTEPILAEWEAFARSIWPSSRVDPAELRDHAEAILCATVADMRSEQTPAEQSAKSVGRGNADTAHSHRLDTASQQHGVGRVESGFRLAEVVAEYRALRASVVRLWRESRPAPDTDDLDDLTRFHESIDQSLARAVGSYADRINQSRHLFLAILGHDLRNPLAAIRMLAAALARRAGDDAHARDRVKQITASADAMDGMIHDLLDLTTTGLGGGISLSRTGADLDALCREVIDETQAAYPSCEVRYARDGDLTGTWDVGRVRQAVSNLLVNAARHGSEAGVIDLHAHGGGAEVVLSVHNGGPPIPSRILPTLFDPLSRRTATAGDDVKDQAQEGASGGRAGLGLYIVHQIVTAHGGTITVTSTAEAGTTFTVRLPRHPSSR